LNSAKRLLTREKTILDMALFDLDMIKEVYARFPERIAAARKAVEKPLTLAEKILYTHLWDGEATTAHT